MPDPEDSDMWACPRCTKRHKGDCNPADFRTGCANCIAIMLLIIGVFVASIR